MIIDGSLLKPVNRIISTLWKQGLKGEDGILLSCDKSRLEKLSVSQFYTH